MLTLTFAGDESGDVSFAFGKGASRYFVVAVVATADPDALRQLLADLRQSSGLPAEYEFSFHALSYAALRERVFEALTGADFESWAIVVDKTALPDPFKVMRGLEFYLYFVTELIRLIPLDKREGATLILDEFGSAAAQRTELRRFMAVRSIPRSFKRILVRRSRSEPLIQVADLVAGAVLRRDAKAEAEAYESIAGKLNQVWDYCGV
jgi:hypothetical protein